MQANVFLLFQWWNNNNNKNTQNKAKYFVEENIWKTSNELNRLLVFVWNTSQYWS